MDEVELRSVALQCVRIIHLYASEGGITHGDLWTRCARYQSLSSAEQFRVQVLLCKERSLSNTVGSGGAFHFYPRNRAPKGAFNIADVRTAGEAIMRAIRETSGK